MNDLENVFSMMYRWNLKKKLKRMLFEKIIVLNRKHELKDA